MGFNRDCIVVNKSDLRLRVRGFISRNLLLLYKVEMLKGKPLSKASLILARKADLMMQPPLHMSAMPPKFRFQP